MSTILLTYDIRQDRNRQIHTLVKDAMKRLGYSDQFKHENGIVYLPNTALIKNNIAPKQAYDDLIAISRGLSAIVERAIAVRFESTDWYAAWGEPFN
jgi:hypothetical protein